MLTIGLVEVGGESIHYVPSVGDGWKLLRLASNNRRQLEGALSNLKLDAVVVLGPSAKKSRIARRVLGNKKHVLVDFPAAETLRKATELNKAAMKGGQYIYSPNLLRTEAGLVELKRIITNSTSNLLSLTVTCGVNAKPSDPGFPMRTAQVLDAVEWLVGSTLSEVSTERSKVSPSAAALVTLASFDNGIKAMLNLYATFSRGAGSRLWVDAVFLDSVVHVDPIAQSVRVTSFRNESVKSVNWATPPLTAAVEDFIENMKVERQGIDLEHLQRALKWTVKVVGS
jgi:hypothetical protein